LLSTSAASSQEPANGFQQQLELLIETLMRQHSVPGLAIGIVIKDKVVYAKGSDVKEIEGWNLHWGRSQAHTARRM